MNDKQLADALVDAEVLVRQPMTWHLLDADGDLIAVFTSERILTHDWRVAGACMERMIDRGEQALVGKGSGHFWCDFPTLPTEAMGDFGRAESLPRAIIEAYVEATDGS